MGRYLVFLIAAGLMTGCASKWEHATKRPSEFRADDRECQLITGGAYQTLEPGDGEQRQSYENCMWDRGWRKTNTMWFFDPKPR